jgi:hypothetical protein
MKASWQGCALDEQARFSTKKPSNMPVAQLNRAQAAINLIAICARGRRLPDWLTTGAMD